MLIRPLAALALLLLSACAHHPPALDAEIEKELAKGIPSIAVAVAKDGRIVHEAAYGFADEGAGGAEGDRIRDQLAEEPVAEVRVLRDHARRMRGEAVVAISLARAPCMTVSLERRALSPSKVPG